MTAVRIKRTRRAWGRFPEGNPVTGGGSSLRLAPFPPLGKMGLLLFLSFFSPTLSPLLLFISLSLPLLCCQTWSAGHEPKQSFGKVSYLKACDAMDTGICPVLVREHSPLYPTVRGEGDHRGGSYGLFKAFPPLLAFQPPGLTPAPAGGRKGLCGVG